jgi:alpha/beta superfamily hydrolase
MPRQEDKMIAIAMPGEEWALEGIFIRGEGEEPAGAVIAPPHPLYGGSMDSPVVTELSWALKQTGHATVRFNWRGVGASGGAPSGEHADADADYAAALTYLEDTASGPLVAAGYSFGAATAIRMARSNPRVRRLLLVAPPPALLDAEALAGFRGRALALVGDRDAFAPLDELRALWGEDESRRLEVVPDADHFFMSGLADVSRLALEWLGAR